jgi:GT2 family glycosyltransferase/O-antigen ligase
MGSRSSRVRTDPRAELVTPRVHAVVVSYNARDDTLASIRSLRTLEGLSGIVVVDNASSDGTDVAVEKEFPGVELVRSPVNRGYGGGNNLGFARALALGAEYVLVVNSDVEITNPRFLKELVAKLEADPAAGIAGPLVRLPDGSVQPTVERWPSVPLALRLALKRRLGRSRGRKKEGRVPAVNGVCFLVRRSVLEATSGFDEQYFMYGEEPDLAARAKAAGSETLFVPVESLIHRHEHGEVRGESARQIRVNFVRFCLDHRSPLSGVVTAGLFLVVAAARDARRRKLTELPPLASALGALFPARSTLLLDIYETALVPALIPVLLVLLAFGSSQLSFLRMTGSSGKFVALGALAAWLPVALVLDRRRALQTLSELRGVGAFLFVFVVLAAVSTTWSDAPGSSLHFAIGLAFLYLATVVTVWRSARALGGPGPLVEAALVGVAAIVLGQVLARVFFPHEALLSGTAERRFRGFLESPNTIAAYVFALPPAVWWTWRTRGLRRAFGFAVIVVYFIEITFSGTRLAIVLVALVLVLHALAARFGGRVAVAAAAFATAFAVAVTIIAVEGYGEAGNWPSALRPSTIPTLSGRTEAWAAAGRMIERRPLTGYGIGTETEELVRYRAVAQRSLSTCVTIGLSPDPCDTVPARRERLVDFSGNYVHNSYLGLAVQLGAIVTLLWGVFLGVCVARVGLAVPRSRNTLAAALFTALPAALIWAFYSTYLWNPGTVVTSLFWLFFTLGLMTAKDARKRHG